MKNSMSVLIAGVLFASSVFAAKVGDTAIFAGTITTASGASYPAGITMKVESPTASGNYMVSTVVTIAGQAQTNTAERTAKEIGDEAEAAKVVANCAGAQGVAETITIGSGEVLATCKFTGLNNGASVTTNIAAVPFLNAKLVQSKNGTTTSLLLQSYVRGQ